jgi:hypothetical protein
MRRGEFAIMQASCLHATLQKEIVAPRSAAGDGTEVAELVGHDASVDNSLALCIGGSARNEIDESFDMVHTS